jgi:hypothetical protein
MYDNPALPSGFREEVYTFIHENFSKEKKEGQTDEQFLYKTRKKGFGPLKQKWWDLPSNVKEPIMKELGEKFDLLFEKLKVVNTKDIVRKNVKPVIVEKPISETVLE